MTDIILKVDCHIERLEIRTAVSFEIEENSYRSFAVVVLMMHGRSDGPKAQKRFGEPRLRSFVAQKRPFNYIPAMEVADVVFSCSKFCWLI